MGECIQLDEPDGGFGFVCIRGGPPVRDRAPCSVCHQDCAVQADGTIWPHGGPRRDCSGGHKPPAGAPRSPAPVQGVNTPHGPPSAAGRSPSAAGTGVSEGTNDRSLGPGWADQPLPFGKEP